MNLQELISRVTMQRPACDSNLAKFFLNEAMRSVLDQRNWAGCRKEIIQYFPPAYSTGTISLTTGSTDVTGTGTNWPYNDVVDTTLADNVLAPGEQWVALASTQGVSRTSIFCVDATGNIEVLPVLDLLGGRVKLNFQCTHAAGASVWQGSLNGLQLRVTGYTTPVYSILATTSPTDMVLQQPWADVSQSQAGYYALLMYVALDPNIKDIVWGSDPFQDLDLVIHVPQKRLNKVDPNREAVNSPIWVSDKGPNANNLMTFEIWPPTYISYKLNFLIDLYWPNMRIQSDTTPPFLNPNTIIYGALAQAFGTNLSRNGKPDPGFSLENSQIYEAKQQKALIEAISGDESRAQTMFSYRPISDATMGVNYDVNHAVDSSGNELIP